MNEKKIVGYKNLEKGKNIKKRLQKMLRVLYSTGLAGYCLKGHGTKRVGMFCSSRPGRSNGRVR